VTRYRKRPVEVEAVQWTGANTDEVRAFLGTDFLGHMEDAGSGRLSRVTVATREGSLVAKPGDWLIRGIQGEHYPVADDIFLATYELVEG
jgi:hypothetical protein